MEKWELFTRRKLAVEVSSAFMEASNLSAASQSDHILSRPCLEGLQHINRPNTS